MAYRSNSLHGIHLSGTVLTKGCVQEVEGPFRCNGGVNSFTLDPKKKSSQATLNLPNLVPRLAIVMPTRIVNKITPLF